MPDSPRAARLAAILLLPLCIFPGASRGEPAYPSAEWTARELQNYAKTLEAPQRQSSDGDFIQVWARRSMQNRVEFQERMVADPDWNTNGNICNSWEMQCAGDPYRYPDGPGRYGKAFYDTVADVVPVNFLDSGGARLSGRVWAPRAEYAAENCTVGQGAAQKPMRQFPGIVIINGSVQAPEPLYWWAAQPLVESCYVVLTFDPRGQGRSDNQTPDWQQGSNANPIIFETNLVDAIDFFYSTPDNPYFWNQPQADGNPVASQRAAALGDRLTAFNPLHERVDFGRFGVAGHSLGARGVSSVQGFGAQMTLDGATVEAPPWPGRNTAANPIRVAVAWDNLASGLDDPQPGMSTVVPRVPTMGQAADYYLTPTPFNEPPDPDAKRGGFLLWRQMGISSMQLNLRGGTHYEWSQIPTFPTSDWAPGGGSSPREPGWGSPLAQHYTLAWFDYWLKNAEEPGAGDALKRLEADADWSERLSFYFTSSRHITAKKGGSMRSACEDLRAGCP